MCIFYQKLRVLDTLKNQEGEFQFLIKAKSGQILLESSFFATEEKLNRAISHLTNSDLSTNDFERKTSHDGQFFFRFNEDDGTELAKSQLYDSEMGMENGIKNLISRINELKDENSL
ncbi:MAG: hypothetical protein CML04_12090 [Pseudozobellia sp.]|nr:hypothetical protein [Pseudozobellia sp.]MBG48487.1 hypothetical protein [Pseudozobellia sp.]